MKNTKKKATKNGTSKGGFAYARAQDEVEKKNSKPMPESVDPQAINDNLFLELEKKFPNNLIAEKLHEMLHAERVLQIRKGVTKKEKDWNASIKALDIILKYKIGKPTKRMEVKATQKMELADLEEMAMTSPEFHKGLKELLDKINRKRK